MMPERLARYVTTLNGLERKGRRRELVAQNGIDFTSNDYLGLARSPRIRAAIAGALERGVAGGSGGSRLLRGNHPEHEALEAEAAAFFGTERALYFSSGYAANTALFSTLPQRGDLVVHDALVHASAHEGIAASRAAAVPVRHNDVQHFDDAIRRWRDAGGMGHPWLAVESLYSMDADRAPLAELLKLADRHDGFLVIDEAHATGVFGPNGRGLAAGMEGRDNVILLHTCGKALGVAGALVGANSVVCEYLINRARGFIYSTAPSPLMAASVRKALKILADEPERRAKFEQLWTFANAQLTAALGFEGSGSQILPVMIGDNSRAMRIAARMRAEGFDIRAIRPPTVPEGTARLRIAITLNVDRSAIVRMFDALANVFIEEAA
ncbi:8-amino-7-oxononanoate synthase [Phyllobacterium brassicacearum]|uniref:8-amino-7-oxononanoate synthase n=1 Tax=Phyllobacterium brassicacearum TaxID=314235 RepID=A0A2P7BUB9_9HYPH|nr:8-amino-7-oxononanoate synthase [Phyllobacterium brassicacearum]PSH70068.1 8-amino-7-oxononanoate synthase [Phyllobacterium brassicacearum]TDQ34071.1 8-amino-7-oxononanoate synthase [Phyllobacterium brassicacearum]